MSDHQVALPTSGVSNLVDARTASAIGNILSRSRPGSPVASLPTKIDEKLDENTTKGVISILSKLKREGKPVEEKPVVSEAEMKFAHPEKKQWLQTGDDDLNALLPTLSDKEKSYLEMIGSKSYEEMIQRIEQYTGLSAARMNMPSLTSILFQTVREIVRIEGSRKHQIESLALDVVLEYPEFTMVKEAYYNDEVKFDVKLEQPNLQMPETEEPEEAEEGELTNLEKANLELAELDFSEQKTKRRLANLLIQGQAINKLYLFNMIKEQIDAIDPHLINLYGILACTAQLGYWALPFGAELVALANPDQQAGSEEVVPQEDKYVIKVRGISLNVLIHELVKGIYEWISLDPSLKRAMASDHPSTEVKDIIAGPELAKAFMSYIPTEKHELVPLVHQKFLQLDKKDIKEVFAKSQRGKRIMQDLMDEAEAEWAEYHKQKGG